MSTKLSAEEFKGSFKSGDQFWWARRWEGQAPEIEGPLTVVRFTKKDMGGWSEDVVEYSTPEGKTFFMYLLSLTNELNGIFRNAEDAKSYLEANK